MAGIPLDPERRMRTWESDELGGLRLELYETDVGPVYGHTPVGYRFYHQDRLLFEGADVAVPADEAIDSDGVVSAVLHWVSMRPGDAEPEYFAHYPPAQLDWVGEHAEEVARIADEFVGWPPGWGPRWSDGQ